MLWRRDGKADKQRFPVLGERTSRWSQTARQRVTGKTVAATRWAVTRTKAQSLIFVFCGLNGDLDGQTDRQLFVGFLQGNFNFSGKRIITFSSPLANHPLPIHLGLNFDDGPNRNDTLVSVRCNLAALSQLDFQRIELVDLGDGV